MQIMSAALRFFVTGREEGSVDAESESSDESDVEARARRDMIVSKQTVKSGRKRQRKVAKARAILKVSNASYSSFFIVLNVCMYVCVCVHRSDARNSNHLHHILWQYT